MMTQIDKNNISEITPLSSNPTARKLGVSSHSTKPNYTILEMEEIR